VARLHDGARGRRPAEQLGLKALEKAGFRFAGIVEDEKLGPCRLFVADRASARPD
jgi:hypothetical protein